eukprot:4894959-Pleurochrysis_carterae.AAC.5
MAHCMDSQLIGSFSISITSLGDISNLHRIARTAPVHQTLDLRSDLPSRRSAEAETRRYPARRPREIAAASLNADTVAMLS